MTIITMSLPIPKIVEVARTYPIDSPCVIFAAVLDLRRLLFGNAYRQIAVTSSRGKNILWTHLLVFDVGSFFIFVLVVLTFYDTTAEILLLT